MYARIPAIAFVIAVSWFAAGILSSSVMVAFVFFLVPQTLAYVWLAPVITALQHLVAAHMRATASATFLLINILIGLGGGSFALGAFSDSLAARYVDEALRYAMLSGLLLYRLAAFLMRLASTPLRQEWVDQSI